jgi:predicted lipoprotein with Yx(FWY)xxD motif
MVGGVVSVAAQELTVQSMQKDGIGQYLADGKGMTLYYFAKDSPGKSVCTGDCLTKWPPLLVDGKTTVVSGLDAKDFGELDTPGGKQVTFRGYSLYRFFKDAKPGDTTGQGVGGIWFVVDPRSFSLMQ